MPSIFGLLHVSQRAMNASQFGVHIANHNIANINTPGYTRQELVLTPSRTIFSSIGEVGTGVQLDQIRRVTDEFLQKALYKETAEQNEWATAADILDRVEILTGIDDDGALAGAITDFFNAFEQLSTNVEDDSVRTIVVNAGVALSERFNSFSNGIDQVRVGIDAQIEQASREVTDLLEKIAGINEQVIAKDSHQVTSNDLKVQRDQLLSQLSELVNFTVQEGEFGAIDVYIAGRNVVHRDSHVAVTPNDPVSVSGELQTKQIDVDGEFLAADRIGGKLGSLVETRDRELASVQDALDLLASTVISRVNGIHERGFSQVGSGVQFFAGNDAGTIQVHDVLKDRPELVAHSYNNIAGDNALARDLAGLRDLNMDELGGRSIVGFYSNLVGDVGSLANTAQGMVENKRLTTGELTTRLENVAGVSLDEEIANVTRYQTMYEAAARLINTVNEMLDVVVGLGATR